MVEVRRCGHASEPHVRTALHSRGATSTPSSDKEQGLWSLGASPSELPRIQICPMARIALDGRLWMGGMRSFFAFTHVSRCTRPEICRSGSHMSVDTYHNLNLCGVRQIIIYVKAFKAVLARYRRGERERGWTRDRYRGSRGKARGERTDRQSEIG